MDEIYVRAEELDPIANLLPRERSAMCAELQAQIADARAGPTGAGRRAGDIPHAAVVRAEALCYPAENAAVEKFGGRADSVALELIDRKPTFERAVDDAEQFREDLDRMLLFRAGDVPRVTRNVGDDEGARDLRH